MLFQRAVSPHRYLAANVWLSCTTSDRANTPTHGRTDSYSRFPCRRVKSGALPPVSTLSRLSGLMTYRGFTVFHHVRHHADSSESDSTARCTQCIYFTHQRSIISGLCSSTQHRVLFVWTTDCTPHNSPPPNPLPTSIQTHVTDLQQRQVWTSHHTPIAPIPDVSPTWEQVQAGCRPGLLQFSPDIFTLFSCKVHLYESVPVVK